MIAEFSGTAAVGTVKNVLRFDQAKVGHNAVVTRRQSGSFGKPRFTYGPGSGRVLRTSRPVRAPVIEFSSDDSNPAAPEFKEGRYSYVRTFFNETQ